jgi:hypothetical protein
VVTCEGCRDQILICHEIKPSSRNNIDKIQLIPVTLSRLHRFYGGVGKAHYLLSVRNKKLIDSERIQGHYLPVFPKVLGEGGRDDLGARNFWRVLGLR